MKTIAGIFNTFEDAKQAAQAAVALGIREQDINLLAPKHDKVHFGDSEDQLSLGSTIGGVTGAAAGTAAAPFVAGLLLPGVGLISAIGLAAMAVLGLGGAALGATAGEALDPDDERIPHDDIHLYESALRNGSSVLFVQAEENEEKLREIFKVHQASDIEGARESWWSQLREAQRAHYDTIGGEFEREEPDYRAGFESAQHPQIRGKSYDTASDYLKHHHKSAYESNAFRQGFVSGQNYFRGWRFNEM